jgi:hypothetical protein
MLQRNTSLTIIESIIVVCALGLPGLAQTPEKSSRSNHYWHGQANRLPKAQRVLYGQAWGVDSFSVRSVESGQLIRFSYRVIDAEKAARFNDEKNKPSLIDVQAGVSLVVPSMEKIGQLRQTAAPQANKTYWMAFSNKGRKVKPGHNVSVIIGSYKIDNLIVQ